MTRRLSLTNLARANLLDATTIAATIDDALQAIDQSLAGWPTSTPGAAPAEGGQVDGRCDEVTKLDPELGRIEVCDNPLPCPDHPTPALSIVERTAGTDRARADLDQLTLLLRRAHHNLTRAARISQAWGTRNIGKDAIASRLAEITDGLWCKSCGRHGFRNVREEGRTECSFCREIRQKFGHPPPKDLVDIHERRNINRGDIDRTFTAAGLKVKEPKKKTAS